MSKPRQVIELYSEIAEAAQWLQEQAETYPFSDIGVSLSLHEGNVRRIDRSLTTKQKATDNGGPHAKRDTR